MRIAPKRREALRSKVIQAIAAGANKKAAAKSAGIDRKTLYVWRTEDPDFATELMEAWSKGSERRDYLAWLNHPFRGLRPPTSKMTRSRPRYSR